MKNIINKVKSIFKKKEVKIEENSENILRENGNKGPLYAYRTKK